MLSQPPRIKNPVPMPKVKPAPCSFCDFKKSDGKVLINNPDNALANRLGLTMSSDGPRSGAWLTANAYDKKLPLVLSSDSIRINYCPFCGRKLVQGKGEVKYEA